jgi:stress-induced morphogen
MYQVLVVSDEFSGVPLLRQHRMVKDLLSKEIAEAHGITVKTMTPAQLAKAQSASA